MWTDVLNKQKKGKVFRELKGQLMNVEVDYEKKVERKNISDSIAGVIPEEENELNTVIKRLS